MHNCEFWTFFWHFDIWQPQSPLTYFLLHPKIFGGDMDLWMILFVAWVVVTIRGGGDTQNPTYYNKKFELVALTGSGNAKTLGISSLMPIAYAHALCLYFQTRVKLVSWQNIIILTLIFEKVTSDWCHTWVFKPSHKCLHLGLERKVQPFVPWAWEMGMSVCTSSMRGGCKHLWPGCTRWCVNKKWCSRWYRHKRWCRCKRWHRFKRWQEMVWPSLVLALFIASHLVEFPLLNI